MVRAIALFSGGLDSTLAILTILKQGITVSAIKFVTPFEPDISDTQVSSSKQYAFLKSSGVDIQVRHLGKDFMEMVKNPKHGYGKNMNPCIDCRIFMLRRSKALMDALGADFIVTGEVLGQRPMSQRKDIIYHIDKEASVTDYVLRPLSAKLLRLTKPESEGIVSRELLYNFSGRSRKPQIALAKEYGLTDYPAPAGGCLLTETQYSHKLKDLLIHDPFPSMRDIKLLKIGRHFRITPGCKIIIGRDELENQFIEVVAVKGDYLLKVEGYGSPLTIVTGQVNDKVLQIAASLCARYSDAKYRKEIEVTISNDIQVTRLTVSPATREIIDSLRIESKKHGEISKV